MNKYLQGLVIVLCVPLLVLGAGAMFNPIGMVEKLALIPQGIHGLANFRGMLGGILLGSVILVGMGLKTKNTVWLLAVAVIMLTAAFGRLVGFIVDGVNAEVVPPFVIELIVAGVLILAHKKANPSNN
jgi:hypothetical protein